MSVLWERFTGQTDTFAVRLAIMPDPHSGEGATPAESVSWGSLQIWVHDQNLCAHTGQGELISSVHWYLLPLFDWLVENWNPLLHEEKLPNRNSGEAAADGLNVTRVAPQLASETEIESWEQEWFDWRSRHAIRSARSGGIFPNVVFRRLRDHIEVSWNSEPEAGMSPGFGFTSGAGSALFDPIEVAVPLYEAVSAAVRYLEESAVDQDRMSELRRQLGMVTLPARQHESRIRWLAGLRHGAGDDQDRSADVDGGSDRWELVVDALGRLASPAALQAALESDESDLVVTGSSQAALLFSSVSPTVTPDDVRTLSGVLVEQFRPHAERSILDELARRVPIDSRVPPWEHGYELAEDLHDELDLDLSAGWVDVESLMDELGVQVVERGLADPGVRACSLIGPRHRPTVVHNQRSQFGSDVARRFTLAHELCHLLYDRSEGARVAIASGPWAPRSIERRANAFAAMFLMPDDLIRSHASGMGVLVGSGEGVTRLAAMLRVSRRAAIEHLYNLSLMTETERDDLLGGANE